MDICVISDSDSKAARICDVLSALPQEIRVETKSPEDNLRLEQSNGNAVTLVALQHLDASGHSLISRLHSWAGDGSKTVVVAPIENHNTVLQAIRAGATDFLADDQSLPAELELLINRLQSHHRSAVGRSHTTLVVPCGCVRDSAFVAVNLATSLAKATEDCALLDFHLSGGDLALLLKMNPRHTLADLLRQECTLDQTVFEQALSSHESTLRLLGGAQVPLSREVLRSSAIAQVARFARKLFGHVVISTDDALDALDLVSSVEVDRVLLTMHMEIVSLHRAKRYVAMLEESGLQTQKIEIAALGHGQTGALALRDVKKFLNVRHVHGLPYEVTSELCSMNLGHPLVLEYPRCKLAAGFSALAEGFVRAADTCSISE